jgi:hypothetical protein
MVNRLVPGALAIIALCAASLEGQVRPVRPKLHVELGLSLSLNNSYKVGNVDQWWEEITVPGESMSDLAPGFDQIDIRFMIGDDTAKFRLGLGFGGYIGSPHAFNAASVAAGRQFAATPNIIFLNMPIQVKAGAPTSKNYFTVEPALGIGYVKEGYLSSGSTTTFLNPLPTVGYQVGVGFDHYWKHLMFASRFGVRLQKIGVGYTDSAGADKQYVVPSTNELVFMDLSGAYLTMGLALIP